MVGCNIQNNKKFMAYMPLLLLVWLNYWPHHCGLVQIVQQ